MSKNASARSKECTRGTQKGRVINYYCSCYYWLERLLALDDFLEKIRELLNIFANLHITPLVNTSKTATLNLAALIIFIAMFPC